MNRLFSIVCIIILAITAINCKKSDDGETTYVKIRDQEEVYTENIKAIDDYLDNNYLIENGSVISFDSIQAYKEQPVIRKDSRLNYIEVENEDYTIMEFRDAKNPNLPSTFKYLKSADKVKYKIYYLLINEGKGNTVSPLDSLYMVRKTSTLKNKVFNSSNPAIGGYYSFPVTIAEFKGEKRSPLRTNTGDRQILNLIKTATGVHEGNQGEPNWNEGSAGRIIAFIPSGLGKFNASDNGLKAYDPYITDITLVSNKERDHDLDGIKTKYEVQKVIELGRKVEDSEIAAMNLTIHDYFSFDTDGDRIPNFLDIDDDGDSVSTKDELSYKDEQGKVKYYPYYSPELKSCGSDSPRYLNGNCFPDRKDGEWIWYNTPKYK